MASDYELYLLVQPHTGDAWSRLALRTTGDATRWKELSVLNRMGDNLLRDRPVRVPFAALRPELQLEVVRALFPDDGRASSGWQHVVRGGNQLEGAPLWNIAEWFTGEGSNYLAIRSANEGLSLSTQRGQSILIPAHLLRRSFREVKPESSRNDAARTQPLREPASVQRQVASDSLPPERVPRPRVEPAPREDRIERTVGETLEVIADSLSSSDASTELEYRRSGGKEYAIYRLKRGEALYSSVVIRFTGRVFARDVNEVVDLIVAENRIADVARIPVDAPIRIPLDLLADEYLPAGHVRRVAYESGKRESARAATSRVEAKNLAGVHIVIDPGHGGRDVGTVHGNVWESVYVYDIALRLKKIIEERTAATVSLTTRSKSGGSRIPERDVLERRTDHVVLTTPEYPLEDAAVGVNLRWYLANSLLRRSIEGGGAAEKVVFLSIHADSLHPSLRGAMAYIPGARFVQGSYRKSGEIYLARAEVRESPLVTQTARDALRAEGLSRQLAESIVDSFRNAGLPVHSYNPVRDNIVRKGGEWVPAVIRYNQIPTRLLLEVGNLGNEEDRKLIQTQRHRQELASAIYEGIASFYESRQAVPRVGPKVQAAAAGR
jgi:N-acetylmuramoyl-L-alanine amidase